MASPSGPAAGSDHGVVIWRVARTARRRFHLRPRCRRGRRQPWNARRAPDRARPGRRAGGRAGRRPRAAAGSRRGAVGARGVQRRPQRTASGSAARLRPSARPAGGRAASGPAESTVPAPRDGPPRLRGRRRGLRGGPRPSAAGARDAGLAGRAGVAHRGARRHRRLPPGDRAASRDGAAARCAAARRGLLRRRAWRRAGGRADGRGGGRRPRRGHGRRHGRSGGDAARPRARSAHGRAPLPRGQRTAARPPAQRGRLAAARIGAGGAGGGDGRRGGIDARRPPGRRLRGLRGRVGRRPAHRRGGAGERDRGVPGGEHGQARRPARGPAAGARAGDGQHRARPARARGVVVQPRRQPPAAPARRPRRGRGRAAPRRRDGEHVPRRLPAGDGGSRGLAICRAGVGHLASRDASWVFARAGVGHLASNDARWTFGRAGVGHLATGTPPRVSARVTTAQDLGRVLWSLHAAATGDAAVLRRLGLSAHQARVGLALLLDCEAARDNIGLFREALPAGTPLAHKNGWIRAVRHDAAIVYAASWTAHRRPADLPRRRARPPHCRPAGASVLAATAPRG